MPNGTLVRALAAASISMLACTPTTDTDKQAPAAGRSFAVGASQRGAEPAEPPSPTPAPGVKAPDETNGECRLYSPSERPPVCCPRTYGVDVNELAESCGGLVFLGEMLHMGCAYRFYDPNTRQDAWIKLAFATDDATPSQIVEAHDRSIQKLTRNETFRSEPLPGVDDGAYSTFDGLGWALLPGWDLPRQVTWKEGFCGDQLPAKLKAIADAPQPPTARPFFREALIPAARPSAAAPAAAPSPPRGATGDIEAG